MHQPTTSYSLATALDNMSACYTSSSMKGQTNISELECSACGKKYDASVEQHVCTCGKPLLARYDLPRAAATLNLEALKSRPRTLRRYKEAVPRFPPV